MDGAQEHREGETEWLSLRFCDFDPDGLLTFSLVRLRRKEGSDWSQEISSTRLWPLTEHDLTTAVRAAGFADIVRYGGMAGAPFHPESSPNMVLVASATGSTPGPSRDKKATPR